MSSPDLKPPVEQLGVDIEAAMAQLFNFQTALINAQGQDTPDLHTFFEKLRQHIKKEWEDMRVYLQKCYGFGGDAGTLKDSLGHESDADCIEFLMEMSASAKRLHEESGELLRRNEDTLSIFSRGTEGFEKQLVNGEAKPTTRNVIRFRDDERLSQFVNAVISASHPDGLAALNAIKIHFMGISSSWKKINAFWAWMSQVCDSFVFQGKIRVKKADAEAQGVVWKDYQQTFLNVTNSIAKSCDAVVVHAVGAPPPPPPKTKPSRGRIETNVRRMVEGVVPQSAISRCRGQLTAGSAFEQDANRGS